MNTAWWGRLVARLWVADVEPWTAGRLVGAGAAWVGVSVLAWSWRAPEGVGWFALGVVAWGGSLALLRRAPLLSLAIAGVLVGVNVAFLAGAAVVGYVLGRSRVAVAPTLCVYGALVLLAPVYGLVPAETVLGWAAVLSTTAVLVGLLPWLVGRHGRHRRELAAAGWQAARNLQQQQHAITTETRVRERARIAREMHDTLGHELTLIALRAGAFEVGGAGTASTADGLRSAEQLRMAATRATEQLNDIVGLLSEESEAPPLRPDGADLDDLVTSARSAGVDVRLQRVGAVHSTSPLVRRATLRLVQEGLTNAAKHAPGASVVVRIETEGRGVTVSVADDGCNGGSPAAPGGGRGLLALTERVRLLGGDLATRDMGPGFLLSAHLPDENAEHLVSPIGSAGEAAQLRSPLEEQLAAGRRRVRRSLAATVLVPATALGLVTLGAAAYFVYATVASVLPAADFEGIDVGDPRAEVDPLLPAVEMLDAPVERTPAPPPGATCWHYEAEVSFFDRRDVYRICFADGAVVTADVLPADPAPAAEQSDPARP